MAPLTINSTVKLASGHEMPRLGFGLYQTPPAETEQAVLNAVAAGYRHFDCAPGYENEAEAGAALLKSGVPRSELFFTSKVAPSAMSYEAAAALVDNTLKVTGLGYVDLFLVHAPYGGSAARKGAWKALVEAVEAGKVRSIGVSNYGVHHMEELLTHIKELEAERGAGRGGVISVGQWEIHPWLTRQDLVDWSAKHGVTVEAYSPLVKGQRLGEAFLKELAAKYSATEAQVLLRWSLQKGMVPLPKSVTPSRITENTDLYKFELTADEVSTLDNQTNEYKPITWDPTVIPLDN